MKKILYISDHCEIGGGESSLLNLMVEMKKNKKYVPILLTPKRGALNKLAEKEGILTFSLNYSLFKRSWIKDIPLISIKNFFMIKKIIGEHNIKIIHANNHGFALTNSLIVAKVKKIKLFWTCHGKWEKPYGFRSKLLNLFLDRIFVVSEYVKKDVDFPKDKVKVSYLGVDYKKIKSGKKDIIRNELKMPSENILIGMIGRYQDVKRQDLFVEMVKKLSKDNEQLKFVIVGDAIFSEENRKYKKKVLSLIQLYNLENKINLLDYREDMENVYAALDLIVVPSEFETFSMVTLEALMNGKKVVATDNGGPREILKDNEFGRIFKSGSVESLCKNINEYIKLEVEKKKLIERSKKFDIGNICSLIEKEYREVLR